MAEGFQARFQAEQSVDSEIIFELEQEREKLVEELVVNFSDSLTGGNVLDFYRVSETLGISDRITKHIQENIWNKLEWGDSTISTGGGFNLAYFLLLNGDSEVFQTVCNSEKELSEKGLGQKYIAELLSAYANAGNEEKVLDFIRSSPVERSQDFWLSLFSVLDSNKCPELIIFIFSKIDKNNLSIEFGNVESIIFLIKSGDEEALDIFKKIVDQLNDEESKTIFLHILVKSSGKEFDSQLFKLFIKIIEKENFEHDDYELSFYFLEKIAKSTTSNDLLKKEVVLWMDTENWQNSEIERFAFSLMYSYHQDDKEICEEFENGMRDWFKQSNRNPQIVTFWSVLVSRLGFDHAFLQELFDGFERDEGAFSEEWSDGKLSELSNPLIGQGMFREIEQIISEKVSHRSGATYLSDRFSQVEEAAKNDDEYNERDILSFANSLYDPVWTKKSLSETKRRLRDYIEKIKSLSEEKPFYFKRLYKAGLDSYGLLSRRLLDVLSGKNVFIDMKKTGSALYILTGKNLGILVNEVPVESTTSWELVHKAGIPVAPIIKSEEKYRSKVILDHDRSEGQKQLKRVYSRYCGLNVLEYLILDHDPQTILDIQRDMDKIKAQLKEIGVDHGHPHLQNFTVEFWKKSVLDEAQSLGININDIVPTNEGDLTFDVEEVNQNPENWVRVVRLIDWDNSSSKEE
jgi:hypothetical protein